MVLQEFDLHSLPGFKELTPIGQLIYIGSMALGLSYYKSQEETYLELDIARLEQKLADKEREERRQQRILLLRARKKELETRLAVV